MLIRQLERYLIKHMHERLSQADVAFILAVEKTHCSRIFRSATGHSFCEWDRSIRVRVAKNMLRQSDKSVSAIASAVGYRDITTFERNFRRVTGMCPTSFRQANQERRKNRRTETQ